MKHVELTSRLAFWHWRVSTCRCEEWIPATVFSCAIQQHTCAWYLHPIKSLYNNNILSAVGSYFSGSGWYHCSFKASFVHQWTICLVGSSLHQLLTQTCVAGWNVLLQVAHKVFVPSLCLITTVIIGWVWCKQIWYPDAKKLNMGELATACS